MEDTTMKRIMLAVLGGCLILAATAAIAEERSKDEVNQPITDEQFVLKASEDGLAEVNHGTLATAKANSPDVKEFARRMVEDHGQANKELLDLANKKGFQVARDMGEKHKAMQERLSGLSSQEFDRHYIHHMVEGHQKAIALFKAEAKNGKDEGLKGFAEKTLPIIQDHLKMARQIQDKLQGGSSDKPAGSPR